MCTCTSVETTLYTTQCNDSKHLWGFQRFIKNVTMTGGCRGYNTPSMLKELKKGYFLMKIFKNIHQLARFFYMKQYFGTPLAPWTLNYILRIIFLKCIVIFIIFLMQLQKFSRSAFIKLKHSSTYFRLHYGIPVFHKAWLACLMYFW